MDELSTLVANFNNLKNNSTPVNTLSTLTNQNIQEKKDNYKPNRTEFINPDYNMGMEFADQNKQLWIRMDSVSIEKQSNKIRPDQPTIKPNTEASVFSFQFLASQELMETLSHEWGPFESVSQSIQQLVGSTMITSMNVVKAIGDAYGKNAPAVANLISRAGPGKKIEIKDINDTVGKTVHDFIAGEDVQSWRIDTPLIYKNTERRSYEFVFNLISLIGEPYNEVVLPVKMLQKLSCPEKPEDSANGYNPLVTPPYVFKVYTLPLGGSVGYLINIPYAALKSVNPTWRGPFINGQPSRCELRLTFQEIEPVFARNILTGNIIDISTYSGD